MCIPFVIREIRSSQAFTEGSEGNKDLQFLSFKDLRYLRFLLLNSSPLAQIGRKRDFLQKTTKRTKTGDSRIL